MNQSSLIDISECLKITSRLSDLVLREHHVRLKTLNSCVQILRRSDTYLIWNKNFAN